jgi:hypothetical protein
VHHPRWSTTRGAERHARRYLEAVQNENIRELVTSLRIGVRGSFGIGDAEIAQVPEAGLTGDSRPQSSMVVHR